MSFVSYLSSFPEAGHTDDQTNRVLTMNMSRYGIMGINYRDVLGSIVLIFAMLPLYSAADTLSDQQLVEQPGQVTAGTEQTMPTWVEPPAGPYQFFPPQAAGVMVQPAQPDAGQAGMVPDPSAGHPDYQGAPYPPAGYPPAGYPSAGYPQSGQMPLPVQDRGYAYEYRYQYQPPGTGMPGVNMPGTGTYGYGRTMPPPAGAYGYGAYPRSNYPAGMRPDYYPYGPTEQMPVQPYYR